MSPRYRPRPPALSSFEEFRSATRRGHVSFDSPENVVWSYLLAPATVPDARLLLDKEEQRTLSKATNPAGGYTVAPDFAAEILSVVHQRSVLARLARELVTGDGAPLNLPTATTHGVATWAAENAAYTVSDEVFGQIAVGAFKAATGVVLSEELATDALGDGFDSFLAAELGGRIAQLEETAFAAGDGSGKPLGVINASSGYPVVTAATGSSTGFKYPDLVSALDALPAQYRPNAAWIFSSTALTSVLRLADTAGRPLYGGGNLLGLPVYVSADFPASAASARSAALGDWSAAYTVRRVDGIGVQRQVEIFSGNGQIGYRAFHRVDGRPTLLEAAVVLRHSAT